MAGLGTTICVSCGKADRSKASDRTVLPERPVSVARAETRAIPRVIHVTGSLAAQEQSMLSAKVAGRLERLDVDIGSVVHRGDVVAQVEPRDYELGLQQAAAALGQARTAMGLPLAGEGCAGGGRQEPGEDQEPVGLGHRLAIGGGFG